MIKMKRKLGIICLLVFAFCIPFVLGACGGSDSGGGESLDLSNYGLEWLQDYFDRLNNVIEEEKLEEGWSIVWKPSLTAEGIDELLSDIRDCVLQSEMELYRQVVSGGKYITQDKYVMFVSNKECIVTEFRYMHLDGNVYYVNFYYHGEEYPAESYRGKLEFFVRLCNDEIRVA